MPSFPKGTPASVIAAAAESHAETLFENLKLAGPGADMVSQMMANLRAYSDGSVTALPPLVLGEGSPGGVAVLSDIGLCVSAALPPKLAEAFRAGLVNFTVGDMS